MTPRILVVEVNHLIGLLFYNLLTDLNCRVDVVQNGQDALEKYTHNPTYYHFIFMCGRLGKTHGCAVTEKIRAFEKSHHIKNPIPIIGNTIFPDKYTVKRFLESGMTEVYVKPLDHKLFEMLLEKYC